MTSLDYKNRELTELYKDLKLFNNEIAPLRARKVRFCLSEKEAVDLNIVEDSMKFLISKILNLEFDIRLISLLETFFSEN